MGSFIIVSKSERLLHYAALLNHGEEIKETNLANITRTSQMDNTILTL